MILFYVPGPEEIPKCPSVACGCSKNEKAFHPPKMRWFATRPRTVTDDTKWERPRFRTSAALRFNRIEQRCCGEAFRVITQSRQPCCDTIPHKFDTLSHIFGSGRVRAVRIDLHTSRRSLHTSDSTAQRICCREPSPSRTVRRCRCTRCSISDSHCCCRPWPFRTDIPDTPPHMPDIPEYTFRSSSFFL